MKLLAEKKKCYRFRIILQLIFIISIRCLFSEYGYGQSEHDNITWEKFSNKAEVNQIINENNPNYELLDLAIFYASNEARIKEKLPPFLYSKVLAKVASGHSEAMINQNFYAHINPFSVTEADPAQRILKYSNEFTGLAENIAQYDLLNNPILKYCYTQSASSKFMFFDCVTKKPFKNHTYWSMAQTIIKAWMNSPGHRANLLNKNFNYLGCGSRISLKPFLTSQVPFMRFTQNFGKKP